MLLSNLSISSLAGGQVVISLEELSGVIIPDIHVFPATSEVCPLLIPTDISLSTPAAFKTLSVFSFVHKIRSTPWVTFIFMVTLANVDKFLVGLILLRFQSEINCDGSRNSLYVPGDKR